MYLRFISPFAGDWESCRRNVDYGIFQATRIAKENGMIPPYMRDELQDELGWFDDHLSAPKYKYFGHRRSNAGICWFRKDATRMISRCWRIASLFRAADIDITLVRTRNPGMILYRDRYQIIAKPTKRTPTKWG